MGQHAKRGQDYQKRWRAERAWGQVPVQDSAQEQAWRHTYTQAQPQALLQASQQGYQGSRRFAAWPRARRGSGLKLRGVMLALALLTLLAVLGTACTREAGPQQPLPQEQLHQPSESSLPHTSLDAGLRPEEAFTVPPLMPAIYTGAADFDAVKAGEVTALAYRWAEPGDMLAITEDRDGWLAVDNGSGKGWMPEWYGTGEAAELTRIEPLPLSLGQSAVLSLYPGSGQAAALTAFSSAYSVQDAAAIWQWRDWYGIVIPLKQPYDQYDVQHPLLLWIEQSNVEAGAHMQGTGVAEADTNVRGSRAEVGAEVGADVRADVRADVPRAGSGAVLNWQFSSIEARIQIVDAALEAGMAASMAVDEGAGMEAGMAMDEVRQLLGEPPYTEASHPLGYDRKNVSIGTDWRYELPDAQLIATWDEEGRLASWHWLLPFDRKPEQVERDWLHYGYASYEFSMSALIPALAPEWLWRYRGDLAHSYLLGEAAGMLLINGDDNGFSGMHDNSNLFALDRETGEKRWQIEAGFGWSEAVIDAAGEAAYILTHVSPEHQRYEERIRKVRLADGKILWDEVLSQAQGRLGLVQSDSGLYILHGEYHVEEEGAVLSVLDAATGKLKWRRELAEQFRLINKGNADPYILISNNRTIKALEPKSGSEKWQVAISEEADSRGSGDNELYGMIELLNYSERPFAPPSKERWYDLGGREHVLVNTHTGKAIARYMPQENELIGRIDNRHWLISRAPDGSSNGESGSMNLSLYDAIAGRELWSISGRGNEGAIDGERLYLLLDGLPTALNLRDGSLIWQTTPPGGAPQTWYQQTPPVVLGNQLLYLHGKDMLVVNKEDGGGMYRVRDIYIGYPDGRSAGLEIGILNVDENGSIYVGAANTYFSRLRLP